MLIGIVGRKGVGKDMCADFLCKHMSYVKRAFADPVKEGCLTLFQLDPLQLVGDNKEVVDERWGMSPRQMMQLLGTDMFRKMVSEDFWIQRFLVWYNESGNENVVVPDVRFQNEVDIIKSLGGRIIRLTRPAAENPKACGRFLLQDSHVSETGVDHLEGVDEGIVNDSSESALFMRVLDKMKMWLYEDISRSTQRQN